MTECERLIANGTFTRDFFKPEVRCDFLVDENRKKLWAILLDLLLQFDRVCKKYDLKYYLIGGSLLGAIRHNGIIPWDDDIDVGMPRDDYEKFLKLADEFVSPYCLQIPGVERDYAYSFAKIRNVNTTGVSKIFAYESFNQGLFLDVFPIDGVVYADGAKMFDRVRQLNIDNSTCMRMSNPHLGLDDLQRIRQCENKDRYANLKEIDRLAQQYGNVDFDYVGFNTISIYPYLRNVFPRESFQSSIMHSFEGFQIPIPIGYDDILKIVFGNYMEFPPKDKRGDWHSGSFFDPDVPYSKYVQEVTRS